MFIRLLKFIKNIIIRVATDDFLGMAAEMAFYCILAVFPFLIFMTSIFGLIGNEHIVNSILTNVSAIAPVNFVGYLGSALNEIIFNSTSKLMVVGFLTMVFVASNGMFVMIKGLNKAYNVEETRPLWYTRLLAISLLFVMVFVIFISSNALILGKWILRYLIQLNILPVSAALMISILRWPIVFFALFSAIFVNYYFMPNIPKNFKARWFSAIPGAFFFCFFWVFASWLFSVYLGHFNIYNKFYGALGVFAISMLWFYYTSLIILIGGEINSQFYNKLKDNEKCLSTII